MKKKAAIAGAMWVTFCMIAPVSPTAPGFRSVFATQTCPGVSTKVSVLVWPGLPLPAGPELLVLAWPEPSELIGLPSLGMPPSLLARETGE